MKRINYSLARSLSIFAYAILVFIFCAIMIAQLEKSIKSSSQILASARHNSQKLEFISQKHYEIVALLSSNELIPAENLKTSESKLGEILREIGRMENTNLRDLKNSYFDTQVLVNALTEEYKENPYSEDSEELMLGIHSHLRSGIKELIGILNSRTEEFRSANEQSNAKFIDLRKYMFNFCIIVGIILLTSAIYLNKLLREPVRELAKAADEIRLGNLEYNLDVRDIPRDELGMLMRNFNVMARRLALTTGKLEEANKSLKKEADFLNALSIQKTKFIRHLGHELRAPLSSIIGFTELLREGYYGDLTEKQEDYLDRINKSANHLLALVNDLVDQAKMQAGTLKLDYQEHLILPFMKEIFSSFEAKSIKDGVQFTFENINLSDGETAKFDAKRIRQAVINLISNAFKFTPAGETVKLRVKMEDDKLLIEIVDTGIGIAEDDIEKIFEEFRQADTVKSSEGAGLGLPLSRQLVLMHGGDIKVQSSLGIGSCFSLILPIARPSDMPDIKQTSYDIL